jgi:hypothetical protein
MFPSVTKAMWEKEDEFVSGLDDVNLFRGFRNCTAGIFNVHCRTVVLYDQL